MIDNLLLGIGAMKAGTTWLYAQLNKHPDIFFAREKEIHFFSHANKKYEITNNLRMRNMTTAIARLQQGKPNLANARKIMAWYYSYINPSITDTWYFNLFRDHGSEKYVADFSNTYAFMDEQGWEIVRRVSETVKVLYTLRNPYERLWSHIKFHNMFVGKQIDYALWDTSDFRAFIKSNQHLVRAGEYAETIGTLRKALHSNEYLILYLDDFGTDPLGEIRRIEQFLDLSPHAYNGKALNSKVNTTEPNSIPSALMPVATKILDRELEQLDRLGIHVPASWHTSLPEYA